jgi:tetratricopeptide (TPR) repeat protein
MPMAPSSPAGARFLLLAVLGVAVPADRSAAQEFVKQTLMVAGFHAAGDAGIARRVAEDVRSRIAKLSNKREVAVLDDYDVEKVMLFSGYNYTPGAYLAESEVRQLARRLRVDEVVLGSVSGTKGDVVVTAQITLVRDWRHRQPLPPVHGATPALAADALAREVVRARAQMAGLRRCENAARAADLAMAAREAEQAIRAYPGATLARNCLLATLVQAGIRADSVRGIADDVLARDSLNIYSAVTRALALDAEQRHAESATAWARVVTMRPDSLELGVTAVEELMRLQRPAAALEATRTLRSAHPNDLRVWRLQFRADVALAHWNSAAALGDSLSRSDTTFQADSNYTVRFVQALEQSGDTLGALASSVRAVKRHPGDSRIYTQYLQLLTAENSAALPRGLLRFPEVSELYVLSARRARVAGKRMEAIAATRQAVRRDPQLLQGFLQLAEMWFEEQRPDSALATLMRAPRTGTGAEMLRSYAIGRGGQLLRSAADSEPAGQRLAVSFLVFADSLDSREDSRSYVAGATLQLARSELVLASRSRGCAEAKRADVALTTSSNALERGVGEGSASDQLRQVFGTMRSAVDNAMKALCKG